MTIEVALEFVVGSVPPLLKGLIFVESGLDYLSWARLTFIQHPMMPRSGLKVPGGWMVVGGGWVVLNPSLVFSLGPS